MRIKNWKALGENGGGALGNFVSHSFYYLEWLFGPIVGMSARLSGLPDDPEMETNAYISLAFRSGAAGNLAMSCASFFGSGHRVEIYGEDGTMMLVNETPDYMRGFKLGLARRSVGTMVPVEVDDPADLNFPADGRIAPVSRLATGFLDAIQNGQPAVPGFAEGLRVQVLLDTARCASNVGRWLEIGPEVVEKRK
jgi:predicted dehydrogenase